MSNGKPTFAVLGTGNAGQTYAADIALKGYEVNLAEVPAFAYDLAGASLSEPLRGSPIHADPVLEAPDRIDTRYRSEDLPFDLATWSALGRLWGAETPQIDALLTIASTMLGRDCLADALSPDHLGIRDLPPESVCALAK